METNKEFEAIMREITSGLTGNLQEDKDYLSEQERKYKDHVYSTEILRACGRIRFEMIPEEQKRVLGEMFGKSHAEFELSLKKIRFLHYKKYYDEALEQIEAMVSKYESIDIFKDDTVSEYHYFKEPMEEIVYRYLVQPEKDLRRATFNYTDLYFEYGSLLFEFKRWEDAERVLVKAMHWDPTYASIAFEHAETFKARGLIDDFGRLTFKIFEIVFRPDDLARCYRNLGYYFVERKEYETAVCCLKYSLRYERSKMADTELFYIIQVTGMAYAPSEEEITACLNRHGIPLGPDIEFLKMEYAYGERFYKEGDMESAAYYLKYFTDFVRDDEAIKMLEDARARMQG